MSTPEDKLPEELREEHDRVLARPPVMYRGLKISPMSFRFDPHYDAATRSNVYWGWGFAESPGAIWFENIGRAKSAIDCYFEAGKHPGFAPYGTKDHEVFREKQAAWSTRFWALMKERGFGVAGASGEVPYVVGPDGNRYLV